MTNRVVQLIELPDADLQVWHSPVGAGSHTVHLVWLKDGLSIDGADVRWGALFIQNWEDLANAVEKINSEAFKDFECPPVLMNDDWRVQDVGKFIVAIEEVFK